MAAAAAVGVGIGALSLISSFTGAKSAKKLEQRKAVAANLANREEIRREDYLNRKTIGKTEAILGGSGVRVGQAGSTPDAYLLDMRREFAAEIGYQRRYGAEALAVGLQSASAKYRNDILQGLVGAGNIFSKIDYGSLAPAKDPIISPSGDGE